MLYIYLLPLIRFIKKIYCLYALSSFIPVIKDTDAHIKTKYALLLILKQVKNSLKVIIFDKRYKNVVSSVFNERGRKA